MARKVGLVYVNDVTAVAMLHFVHRVQGLNSQKECIIYEFKCVQIRIHAEEA